MLKLIQYQKQNCRSLRYDKSYKRYLYLSINFYIYRLLQTKIISELQNNGVHIYQFPTDDESVTEINTSMNAHVPFAVVGSTDFVRVGNKMMRSRQYPWGTVQGKITNCLLILKYIDYSKSCGFLFL